MSAKPSSPARAAAAQPLTALDIPDAVTVTADTLNQRPGLIIPRALFTAGDVAPFWRLSRVSGAVADSPARSVRVKLDLPGGADPDPSTPHNENLAAPQLPADIGAAGLDAARAAQGVDVTVPAYPGMAAGDLVTLVWSGTTASGAPTDWRSEHTVSGAAAGNPVSIVVPAAQITPLDGGRVTVRYDVAFAAGGEQTSAALDLTVGAAAGTLPAPAVDQAVNGTLPQEVQGVTVRIPAYPGMVTGDRVDLFFTGDVTGNWGDWLPVTAATAGHQLEVVL